MKALNNNTRERSVMDGVPAKPKQGLTMKYFVLTPTKKDAYGKASRLALMAYADSIEKTNPLLRQDLHDWLVRIGY